MEISKGLFFYIGICIITFVLLVIAVSAPAYLVTRHTCAAKAERLGLEYSFGFFQGCFVKDGDSWVDYDRYRVILEK